MAQRSPRAPRSPRESGRGSTAHSAVRDRPDPGEQPTALGADGSALPRGTRERILDIALDLFIDKGFDKASLREIAEELGFSKAALYYHFVSKDDILMALHLRLHEVLHGALSGLGDETGVGSWAAMLDRIIDQMLANRRLFVLHERNRAAFEHLHKEEGHDAEHDDFESQFRLVLADENVPLKDRVRLACSLGAVMSGLFLAGDLFGDAPSTVLGDLLREAVRDLLGDPVKAQ